jgi:hypothetical protein|tara:strand:+ start:3811 stop:4023 length:213 start_codon:yes stop_codon:yes gene_type:complete
MIDYLLRKMGRELASQSIDGPGSGTLSMRTNNTWQQRAAKIEVATENRHATFPARKMATSERIVVKKNPI